MNQELRDLFEQDQADRHDGMHPGVADRDRQRRERLAVLIAGGALHEADDYWRAHELAERGATTGPRWLPLVSCRRL